MKLLAAHLAVNGFAKDKQDGQYVGIDVHQKARGDDLPTAEQSSQRAMAMVYGEEHPPQT